MRKVAVSYPCDLDHLTSVTLNPVNLTPDLFISVQTADETSVDVSK